MSKLFIFSFILFIFSEVKTYAYLDPGTGSIILQAIIGAIAAISSFFYYYWNKVKKFINKFKKNKSSENKKNK